MEQRSENNWNFLRNVILKGLGLFLILNLLFAWVGDSLHLGRISGYNTVFPGRLRFPFGENAAESFNLSLYDFQAIFASHAYFGRKDKQDEFRVILIGDSSIWGTLLRPEQTIAGQLNQAALTTCDGKPVHFYNLGYPSLSLTKDLIVLDEAMKQKPDLILWFVTLESFPRQVQFSTPIVANNPARVDALMQKYDLAGVLDDSSLNHPTFLEKTIVGKRRSLADLVRLQFYGVMWAATGKDQFYPESFTPAQRDLDADLAYHDWNPGDAISNGLAWEVLSAGIDAAGDIPVVLINEPILISQGKNSDLRYNYYYPRWVYDAYREWLRQKADEEGWVYFDMWNTTSESEFTNTAIHMTPSATGVFARNVWDATHPLTCTNADRDQ